MTRIMSKNLQFEDIVIWRITLTYQYILTDFITFVS